MLLGVHEVTKSFGGVKALDGVSLNLEENRIHGLIGPNGSGKTTLFNVITGLLRPDSGEVSYKGEPLIGLPPRKISRKGIARTFQLTRLFTRMTVSDNLLFLSDARDESTKSRCMELLKLFELDSLKDELTKNLSYGQRKQLEFARILFMDPDLIMLDEPMAGLTRQMTEKMIKYIRYAHEKGKTVFIIEHNLPVIMSLCERIFVLDNGRKIAEGSPAEIGRDKAVINTYVGDEQA